jgi:hypothetical protein
MAQMPKFKPTTAALPPQNGVGILTGGQVLMGQGFMNWIDPSPFTTGVPTPGMNLAVPVSGNPAAGGLGIPGGWGNSFSLVPSSQATVAPPSGNLYLLYNPDPPSEEVGSQGFSPGVLFPWHYTPGWQCVYIGNDDWAIYDAGGNDLTFQGHFSLMGESWPGMDSWTYGASWDFALLDEFGHIFTGELWTNQWSVGGLNASATWYTFSIAQVIHFFSGSTSNPNLPVNEPSPIPLRAIAPIIGSPSYFGASSTGNIDGWYIDNVQFGPQYGGAGVTTVEGCLAQGLLGILKVPWAQFTNTWPAAPSSGTASQNNIVYLDTVKGVYGYAVGTSTTGTPQDPQYPAPSVPVARVVLSTTSASVESSTVTDLRVIVGHIYG